MMRFVLDDRKHWPTRRLLIKFRVQKSAGKVLASNFVGSRWYRPNRLCSKGPNYQRGVLLISAGATEGQNPAGRSPRGVLFLHDNAPAHRVLATQKKVAYLGFQCLDHPPYSPDLAPSDCRLLPGLKKTIESRNFSSDAGVIAAGWTDNHLIFFFWVACKI